VSTRLYLLGQFDDALMDFTLDQNRAYVVGRASTCDIVVNALTVSRIHAEIRLVDFQVQVTDRNSRNGTFVDNAPVNVGNAVPGQKIRFGHAPFLLLGAGGDDGGESDDMTVSGGPEPTIQGPSSGIHLTEARKRVFDLLIQGLSKKEIAFRLGKSQNTVHHQIFDIYRAYDVTSMIELLIRFRGEVRPPSFFLRKPSG